MGELGILGEKGEELINGVVCESNPWRTPRRWTYEDWDRMVMGGIIGEDERLQLMDGEFILMESLGHRHIYTVDLLTAFLGEQACGRGILRVQSPLRFNAQDAPVPDLVLLRFTEDRYLSRQAGPWDALLVVEVADTTIAEDKAKAEQYARAAIPEYWIVDLDRPAVIVQEAPLGGEYSTIREYRHGDAFSSFALAGREVRLEEVLGPSQS